MRSKYSRKVLTLAQNSTNTVSQPKNPIDKYLSQYITLGNDLKNKHACRLIGSINKIIPF